MQDVLAAVTALCQVISGVKAAPLQIVAAPSGTKLDEQQLNGKKGLKVQIAGVGAWSAKEAFIVDEIWAVHLKLANEPQIPFGKKVVNGGGTVAEKAFG